MGKAVVDHDLSSTRAFFAGLRAGLQAREPFPRLPAGPATLSPFEDSVDA